ncbi:MAG: glycosyltransferase family 4 protein [Candidatus Methanoperedens sp.]|nr:glycosyltransferase family 4 protein [Candidatus Methanoperedens sp.]MCZ7403903.1 glycosyltransferase family 4 protein [Candidatus Methanoperedens sp.]
MKVIFKQITGGSGVDIWANNLSKEVIKQGTDSSVKYFPQYYAFFPHLLSLKNEKLNESYITHSNISYGFAFKTDSPLVVTEHHLVHDSSFSQYSSFPQKMYYKFVYKCEEKSLKVANTVTCISEYTKQKVEEIFGYYDSKMIYNGVNTDIFKPIAVEKKTYGIPETTTVLFFAGNLSKRKGSDLLPRIMNKLGDNFILITTSGLRTDFKEESKNIKTIGRLSETGLVKAYNLCDIFLFPSRLEGFGLTVAEAMACGKPVVTTNCSSLPELIVDGKGGFLCKIDDVKDFADKIKILAEDENLQKKMGEYNRRRVLEKFTLKKMAEEYIKIYRTSF